MSRSKLSLQGLSSFAAGDPSDSLYGRPLQIGSRRRKRVKRQGDARSPFPQLGFTLSEGSGSTRLLELAGELDLYAAQLFRKQLEAAPDVYAANLIVSLPGISYIDSSGVGFLVELAKGAAAKGTRIALVGAQPRVTKILALTGAETLFVHAASVEQAKGLLEN